MNVDNKELARILWETADLMEIAAEDGFRIRSYRNGATAIEGHPESIATITARAGVNRAMVRRMWLIEVCM